MKQKEKEGRRVLEWVSHYNIPNTNRPKLIYGDYLQKFHLESRLIHNFIKKSNLLFITASILSTTWGFSQGVSVMRGRARPAALNLGGHGSEPRSLDSVHYWCPGTPPHQHPPTDGRGRHVTRARIMTQTSRTAEPNTILWRPRWWSFVLSNKWNRPLQKSGLYTCN